MTKTKQPEAIPHLTSFLPLQNLYEAAQQAVTTGSTDCLQNALHEVEDAIAERDRRRGVLADARERYDVLMKDGDLDIDASSFVNPVEGGYYVEAWLWVPGSKKRKGSDDE